MLLPPVLVESEIPFTENFLREMVHGLAHDLPIIQRVPEAASVQPASVCWCFS